MQIINKIEQKIHQDGSLNKDQKKSILEKISKLNATQRLYIFGLLEQYPDFAKSVASFIEQNKGKTDIDLVNAIPEFAKSEAE